MLVVKYSHEQYQDFVCDFLTRYYISTGQQITIVTGASLVVKLWGADLTGIVQLIKNRYSRTNRGTPPKDAVALLRSLILMTLTGETSIPKWVDSAWAGESTISITDIFPVLSRFAAQSGLCFKLYSNCF